jgi:hypothetical protein
LWQPRPKVERNERAPTGKSDEEWARHGDPTCALNRRRCLSMWTWYEMLLRISLMARTQTKSILDLPPDDAAEARLDAQAEAEIEAGPGVSHKRVREWLAGLVRGDRKPPPET